MKIKKKTMRRDEWRGISEKTFRQTAFDCPGFSGAVGLLCIRRAHRPLYAGEERLCVVGEGVSWLELAPRDDYWFITAMFDPQGRLFEYYIDLTDGTRVEPDGTVWFHDLFLDVIMTRGKAPRLEDADELRQALCEGLITQAQYDRTLEVGNRLLEGLRTREDELRAFCEARRRELLGGTGVTLGRPPF